MKRIFDYNVIEKYAKLSPQIKKYVCDECDFDYDESDENTYQYDFDDGFVCFVFVGGAYFAMCGFLDGAETLNPCIDAIKDFKNKINDIDNFKIYAKVNPENKKSAFLINCIGFKRIFNVYEYKE